MTRLIDFIYNNPRGKIQIPRSYGYALYEHDEENGGDRIGPFRFRRLGGFNGPAWENVLVNNEYVQEGGEFIGGRYFSAPEVIRKARRPCGFCGELEVPVLFVPSADKKDQEIPVCEACRRLKSHEKYSAVSYSAQLKRKQKGVD